ncbi:MAG: hypothetical protein PF505_12545, partial [Vallitaleaceae bacterium]|nr:hypothetical protein [Vallitaleaceae bacterium]
MIEAGRASISVFLSVIFLSLVILSCSVVDLTRIYVAKGQSERALNIGAKSILASFDSELALAYGIYGYDNSAYGTTNMELLSYFKESLSPGSGWNDYDITNTKVASAKPLLDIDYINDQIMQYMKYRGPYLAIEPFFENLDIFAKSTKTAEIISLNNQIASSIEAASTNYIQLETLVDGILIDDHQVILSTNGTPDIYPEFVKKFVPTSAGTNSFNIPDALLLDTIESSLVNMPSSLEGLCQALIQGEVAMGNFQYA